MRLSYEKHVKYINLIEVKHNSLIKQQKRQQMKHKIKFKKNGLILVHAVQHKQ